MSPWRVLTSLCLIFSLIDPSEEGCGDYLKLETWNGTDLNRTLPLAQNKDPNDLLYCTLKLAFKNETENDILFNVLRDCFEDLTEKKPTCEGLSSQNISFYHLMCLVAKSQGYPPGGVPPEGCKYETVCKLYPRVYDVAAKTTTPITTATSATPAATASSLNTTPAPPSTPAPPTTTASPPSTPAPPTTTPAPPTTTASPPSTPAPPTTTASPPPPPPTPAPTPTLVPVTTTDKHEGGNANSSTGTRESSNTKVMYLLIISVTLNFVLPLVVFLFMRQRTQHRTQNPPQDESSVLDETCDDPDPLPLIPTRTKPDCPDVHSPSADTPRNPCTAGNGLGSH